MAMLTSPWVPLGVLAALSLISRKLQGSWLAPSAFAGALWSIYIALPLAATGEHISARSIWLLVSLIGCLQVGAFIFEDPKAWVRFQPPADEESLATLGGRLLRVSLFLTIVALVGAIFYALIWLRNLDLSFSLEGFLSMGGNMYDIIVSGEPDPWWSRLSRMWVFPSVLLGGFSFVLVRSRTKKLLTLSAFVPALFLGTAIASRFATLLAIPCWMAGYLSMKCFLSRGQFRISPRFVGAIVAIAFAAVAMFAGLYTVRGRKFEDTSEASVKIGSDILAYLAVFDNYVRADEPQPLGLGVYTVGGLFEFLGVKTRERNLNWQPVILETGVDSNIYTAFRGLIDDFSLPGSMILLLLTGAFVGWAYTQLCCGKIGFLWPLAGYYIFLLFSPIVSAFYYNSVPLALLVGALVIRNPKPKSRVFLSSFGKVARPA
jgi:oligosaccharide repeat unit polymerase